MFELISFFGLCGIAVCLYAIGVERRASRKKAQGANFDEACDIRNRMSCSAVLTSKYAHMLGYLFNLRADHPLNLSNSYYGLGFYGLMVIYPFLSIPYSDWILYGLTSGSLVFSAVLSYCMFILLNDVCLVCMAIHIINICLFMYA